MRLICTYNLVKKDKMEWNMDQTKKKKCLSCGLCEGLCPTVALRLKYETKEGIYRPNVDKAVCTNCGICDRACIIDGYSLCRSSEKNYIGDFLKIQLFSATDKTVRRGASSGGVANRLIKYLIETKMVEAVLMVCEKTGSRMETGYIVLTAANLHLLNEVPRKFASRYCVVPILVGIKRIQKYSKVATVGTPCQIYGVTKYEQLKGKEVIKIGIACSQGINYKATELMLKKRNADGNKVYYRGDGWPGKNTIVNNGKCNDEDHLDSLFNLYYASQIFRNPACNNCNDQFNEYADISFFDYWNEQEKRREHIGKTGVIIRNKKMEECINDMEKKGVIIGYGDISLQSAIQSQSWAIRLKKNPYSFRLRIFFAITEIERKLGVYRLYSRKMFEKHSELFHRLLDY